MKQRADLEFEIQSEFFNLVNLTLPGLAIAAWPNGEKRDRKTAIKLKRMGVRPGFPDVFCPYRREGYIGLWIEFKKPGEDLSDQQKLLFPFLENMGYKIMVCDNANDALEQLKQYICGYYVPHYFYKE